VVVLAVRDRIPARVVRAADAAARWFFDRWWKIPALAALAVPVLWDMSAWWIDTPRGWMPDLTIYLYYLGFFLAGALLYRHRDLLPRVGRNWPLQLVVANVVILPLMLKLTITGSWAEESLPGELPAWLVGWKAGAIFLGGLYTWLTIAGLLGLFQHHFGGSAGWWRYLADASYWCYLAGFPVQAALQVWLAPVALPIVVEFLLVNALTFTLLLVSYELCVRHTWVGLMLNGKRPERKPRRKAEPVVIQTRVTLPEMEYPPAPKPARDRPARRDPLPAQARKPASPQARKPQRSGEHAPLPAR